MSTSVIRGGYDTHIQSAHPNTPYHKSKTMRLHFGSIRGLLYMPLAGILGQTVLSAELTGHAGPDGLPGGQTLTFAPVAALPSGDSWIAAETTWANQPPLLGTGSATVDTGGGIAAGGEFAVNVTSALQSVTNGTPWYGWRVTCTATTDVTLRSFNAAAVAWTLTVELSEVNGAPSMLSPNGTVVGRSKPILGWDASDLSSGQVSVQVQLDPASDGVSPNYDSGELAIKDPEFDTAAHGYAGLAPNGSDAWRVRRKIESSPDWGPWSDWAPFTYVPKVNLTLISPASGVLWDPTATVLVGVSPATMKSYAVRVTSGTDRTDVLYDSHKQPAGDPALVGAELPASNENNSRILVDDRDYQLNVRVYDDENRAPTTGDPVYAELWATFHFDDDLGLTPVATTSAHQVGTSPGVRITWTRSEAGDKWVVFRDDQIVATLEPEDTVTGVSTYSWVDWTATPNMRHVYKVKAVVNDRQTAPGPLAVITPAVEGIWFLSSHGNVRIDGVDVDGWRSRDKRATYKMLRGPDVDVVHGFEGVSADDFKGSVENEPDQSFEYAGAVLKAIHDDPTTPIRMVYGSKNIQVQTRNLSVDPASDMMPDDMRHNVVYGFWEL